MRDGYNVDFNGYNFISYITYKPWSTYNYVTNYKIYKIL